MAIPIEKYREQLEDILSGPPRNRRVRIAEVLGDVTLEIGHDAAQFLIKEYDLNGPGAK